MFGQRVNVRHPVLCTTERSHRLVQPAACHVSVYRRRRTKLNARAAIGMRLDFTTRPQLNHGKEDGAWKPCEPAAWKAALRQALSKPGAASSRRRGRKTGCLAGSAIGSRSAGILPAGSWRPPAAAVGDGPRVRAPIPSLFFTSQRRVASAGSSRTISRKRARFDCHHYRWRGAPRRRCGVG
jgi:hypothetical protein